MEKKLPQLLQNKKYIQNCLPAIILTYVQLLVENEFKKMSTAQVIKYFVTISIYIDT